MTNCTGKTLEFPSLKNLKIEASFSGGSITSGGGILLLRQVEQRIKLLEKVAKIIPDDRETAKITHWHAKNVATACFWTCLRA